MKREYGNLFFALALTGTVLFIMQIAGCKKQSSSDIPVLTTDSITNITPVSAICYRTIISEGIGSIMSHGVCWSTKPNPTILDSQVSANRNYIDRTAFIMSGLKPVTKYFSRAFARNAAGPAYGKEISFTTPALSLGQSFVVGTQSFLLGIVFYIDSTGQHGLLAAPKDQGKLPWDNGTHIKSNATSSWDGESNTNLVVSTLVPGSGNSQNTAAHFCRYFMFFLYDKPIFFLPSKDQLNLMYVHKNMIGNFSDLPYWSSTEADINLAFGQDFSNGNQSSYDKSSVYSIRAIMSF